MKYPTKYTAIIFTLISIVSLVAGINYNIYILKTLGYMLPCYAGTAYRLSVTKEQGKQWSLKKHLFLILSLIMACISLTLIGHGCLW